MESMHSVTIRCPDPGTETHRTKRREAFARIYLFCFLSESELVYLLLTF